MDYLINISGKQPTQQIHIGIQHILISFVLKIHFIGIMEQGYMLNYLMVDKKEMNGFLTKLE
jgi:hypothetical protein